MQASEMNLDQCRDVIAESLGWRFAADHGQRTPQRLWVHEKYLSRHEHPIDATLDAAAAAMPEGWYWVVNFTGTIVPFLAIAVERVPTRPQIEIRADTELLARFRLAVACRQAQGAANDKWQGAAHEG